MTTEGGGGAQRQQMHLFEKQSTDVASLLSLQVYQE
jgi:hypothetical protein